MIQPAAVLLLSAAAVMILQVDGVQVSKVKGGLTVHAAGTASTPGWTDVRLELKSSKGGHLVYELVGTPASGMVAQVLAPIGATRTWKGKASKIRDVTVKARTNEKTVTVTTK
jgi:hypothetical protein